MLQTLLVERFSLAAHMETRDLTSYELVVAKGGLKMKDAEKAPAGEPPPNAPTASTFGPPKTSIGPDGVPVLPPGTPMWISLGQGVNVRIVARMQTTAALASMLGNRVGRPVVDRTGLTGTYDFKLLYTPDPANTLSFPPPPPAGGDPTPNQSGDIDAVREPVPYLLTAVEVQLGLKLEPKKAPGKVLVVERYSRKPTAN